ncbi:MAG: transcriptional regulator [Candidatus Sericytochromatia bacterium]|nr:MAG: transcriptional regulator [Candidatus Sericytochromatia bacterium]
MINLLIVEDNEKLRLALSKGFSNINNIKVLHVCDTGEEAFNYCLQNLNVSVVLMDVQLAGIWNGIETAIELRKEFPRIPIIFYSIQDDENYFKDFCNSGILTHYAYVRKSNYLLPEMLIPLILDSIAGLSFIDPDIEVKVKEVKIKEKNSPMALLEPNEQKVAKMIAYGMTNEQIAERMGFKDKRTISRINGQIYTMWNLNKNPTDDKVARTRASIIYNKNMLIEWDEQGNAYYLDENRQRKLIPFDEI